MVLTPRKASTDRKMIFDTEECKLKTLKNKIADIVILGISISPMIPSIISGETDIDCTYMVFVLALCICLFFSKESWFYEDEN